jgi:hypothetical protein
MIDIEKARFDVVDAIKVKEWRAENADARRD